MLNPLDEIELGKIFSKEEPIDKDFENLIDHYRAERIIYLDPNKTKRKRKTKKKDDTQTKEKFLDDTF